MRKQQGLVSIEFSISFLFFALMILAWGQMCTIGFISSILDYSISQSVAKTRSHYGNNYNESFNNTLRDMNSLWFSFLDMDSFKADVKYFSNIVKLSNGMNSSKSKVEPIALYSVSYDYKLPFTIFSSSNSIILKREVIAVQENERETFN
jgi:tight adherence protein E